MNLENHRDAPRVPDGYRRRAKGIGWPRPVIGGCLAIEGSNSAVATITILGYAALDVLAIPPVSRLLARSGRVYTLGFSESYAAAAYTYVDGHSGVRTAVYWEATPDQIRLQRQGVLFAALSIAGRPVLVLRKSADVMARLWGT